MCGKLLLNLIDCIIRIPNKNEGKFSINIYMYLLLVYVSIFIPYFYHPPLGRDLLMRILDAFACKFSALNIQFKTCLKQYIKKKKSEDNGDDGEEDQDNFDFDKARSIHTASFSSDPQHDGIKDGRFLFKNLAIGLKPLFIGLRHCNPAPTAEANTQTYSQFARGFSHEDINTFIRLFKEGLICFEYYNIDNYGPDGALPNEIKTEEDEAENSVGANNQAQKISNQVSTEKDILDMFAVVFTLLDPAVFQEIFVSQMGFFFDRMLINTSLVHIAQYFLVNDISSQGFAGILFRFLIDRIDHLGDENVHYSAVMLHLFRLAFMAVNLFPDANESILQPYLGNLVTSCFKLSAKAKEPANYFLLLRILFKSIGGGRFELLYKEVSPLLQVLLENLNSLLTLAHTTEMRNLFVELCLAVPVRLSTLLPYLPYLMRPLVIALQADEELVTQGLRTMELCNDNLNPEFLDHIMAPVMKELMDALWSHLKPLPYNQQHSHTAMRILGKLGGRNRRMLNCPPKLDFNKQVENGISVEIVFDPNTTTHSLPLDECLKIACKTLENNDVDIFYKRHALEFLKANIILMMDLDQGTEGLAQSLYQRVKKHLSKSQPTDTKDTINDMDVDKPEAQKSQNESDNSVVGDTLQEAGLKPKRLLGNGYTKYLANRVAQEEALRTMLSSVIKASTIPEIADEAWLFFQNVCRHFMLLHIGEVIEAKEVGSKPLSDMMDERLSVQNINTTVLVDAVVKVISSSEQKLRRRAEEALQLCFDTAVQILGGKEYVWQLPIFRVFASQFGSSCYKQEWYNKRGGCLGISIISSQLDMGTKWMREHELDFIRSLLFVLKDASPEMANVNTADAIQTLSHVLKVCNRPEDDESQEAQQKFQNLITLLLSELSNSNSAVRETIQSSFQLLADLTGNEVTELLAPLGERLVAPIFAKPLRALPFAMQIGHIDAITYCLTLRPPFLEFNDELIRLLHEALALADAEDQALVSRSSQYKNATSLMNLRIVCIKLLSAAMACSDFSNQRQTHTRARIIQVFFKSLYSKAPEVVEAAHRGLKQVLAQQHKLPKELLQQGLRPILTTLSNHKTLSVAGLEGLARLLELLTNYFKVEIGKKLLDHLKQWADPKLLQEAAGKSLSENHEVKIIVAILNIFHLLPAAAHIFLDDLVSVVLEMEVNLRRSISSPFRPNLIKYLNRYPTETVAYFYERLDKPAHCRLFVDILDTDAATQLREEVAKSSSDLIEKTFSVADNSQMHYQGVLIVHEIVKFNPNWLVGQPTVLEALLKHWRQPNRFDIMKRDDDQGLLATRESLYLSQIFISYLRVKPDNIDILFEIASLFGQESVMDLSYLEDFFLNEVAINYSPKLKNRIIAKFLDQFNDSSVLTYLRMMVLRHVINPVLLVSITRKNNEVSEILDGQVMEQLDLKIWASLTSKSTEEDQYAEDSLRIELLQLTAMIVQYAPQLLTDMRKEIIKFGWEYLRLEDATCKQASYVLIARFISAFETPSKIVIQIYAALLRAHLSEARILVKQGLDILSPMLPKRVPLLPNERVPTWVRLTRKVVVEDTHSISQMVNVYQLLVRQPDLFYDYREHFLPQIASALPKLGLLQNATPENKLLTVELTELILSWEEMRLKKHAKKEDVPASPSGKRTAEPISENPKKKVKGEGADGEIKKTAADASSSSKEYAPPLTLRENTVGYLVRLACNIYNPTDMIQRRLVQRVLDLIKRFLSPDIWSDVHVKFAHLERTLTVKEMSEILVSSVCSALEILSVDIAHKPTEWFIVNMNQLFRLLENSIKSDNVRIHTALQPVLSHIFSAINQTTSAENREQDTQHPDVAAFVSLIDSAITDGIAGMTNIYAVFKVLQATSSSRGEQLDPFVPGVVKMLQKLTKEHIMAPHTTSTGQDSQVNLLILGLNLLKKRISHLGDQRRWFLTCLIQLIEKSPDFQLLHAILDMLDEWTFGETETFPTIKEKAGLLVKMMTFESRGDIKLSEDFLELVIKIYNTPSFARSELTVRLEQAFLLGTRSDNPQIRTQFMRVFDRSVSRVLYPRLNYILGIQNWETLANTFWLHQALDLLLGTIRINHEISTPQTLKIKPIKIIGNADEPSELDVPEELNDIVTKHQAFLAELQECDINNSISSARYLQYLDDDASFKLWTSLFPICWSILSSTEKHDMTKVIINLLAKDYHNKQTELRPNVIQALLTGIARADANIRLPPHLVKYLGKTHNAWHISTEILQKAALSQRVSDSSKDDQNTQERTLDALSELYSDLGEQDIFDGLWKRRCTYSETNVAVSYEQGGMWAQAQTMYESAQIKARSGVLPFTESEYMLWEDHWIACSQKLQQWDILADLAKHDNSTGLLLDCAWQLSDWAADRELLEQSVTQLSSNPTPRLKAFGAFLALIKSQTTDDRLAQFNRLCEEGVQLSLQKWYSLPHIVSQSHLPLLHIFQQFLELQEASQIFSSLSGTTAQNLEMRSNEIRSILGNWRERLPNVWDDINIWSDTVAWRQHIFHAINRTYVPLIPMIPPQPSAPNGQTGNSFAYRGHHETAWIINKFAHIARKHKLEDVCTSYLAKIYTLPNIEIQEAFLKLREQAKCYYHNPDEVAAGLDIISNTNLVYFNQQQKAEFYTLKGQFLAKLNHFNEANEAFVNAVQIDLSLARAWAGWGRYNDRRFKENPKDLSWANNAVSCYLQAAGIYKNGKTRKYLLRVLWLLSLDDQNGTISRAFEVYKGEWPVWYWITFIPQLLMGLQQRESKHARVILMRIAKQFPQSLHFQLRTAKEDMVKRNTTAAAQAAAQAAAAAAAGNKPSNGTVDGSAGNTPDANKDATVKTEQNTSNEAGKTEANQNDANGEKAEEKKADVMEVDNPDQVKNEGDTVKSEEQAKTENIKEGSKSDEKATDGSSNGDKPPPVLTGAALNNANKGSPQTPTAATPSHPLDDIMAMLKTGYPLLALSMETMVDQIQLKFKPQADEDMYRLVVALYNEGIQVQYIYTIFFFLFHYSHFFFFFLYISNFLHV
jgi:transformation/transcription domain-associated protein